jgi:hypothetical protein
MVALREALEGKDRAPTSIFEELCWPCAHVCWRMEVNTESPTCGLRSKTRGPERLGQDLRFSILSPRVCGGSRLSFFFFGHV